MPADSPSNRFPTVGRLGLAAIGTALFCRRSALPLVVGGLAAMIAVAALRNSVATVVATPPPRVRRARRRDSQVTTASEDSFPASDPPSWTPVTGPGTRH